MWALVLVYDPCLVGFGIFVFGVAQSCSKSVGPLEVDGGSHSCTLCLLIILTLEEEVGVGEAELQQGCDLDNGHGAPLWECSVLL